MGNGAYTARYKYSHQNNFLNLTVCTIRSVLLFKSIFSPHLLQQKTNEKKEKRKVKLTKESETDMKRTCQQQKPEQGNGF